MFSRISTARKLAFVAAVAALAVSTTALGSWFVVAPPPPSKVAVAGGKTYSTLAADWWKWALSQTAANSALLDLTGDKCAAGQSPSLTGNNLWFLAGYDPSLTPVSSVTRNCTLPLGRTLVFPITNAGYGVFPNDPADQQGEAFARSMVEWIKNVNDLYLTIDGVKVTNLNAYLERSDAFNITLGASNMFTPTYPSMAGQALVPFVDAGYYVVVSGLTTVPGKHVIQFGGNGIKVTYNLNVKVTPF